MHIRIHVRGIKGSSDIESLDDYPRALFSGILEVDGQLMENAGDISVTFGEKFSTVNVDLFPSQVDVVTHTKETWPGLIEELDEARSLRRNDGALIARVK